MDAFQTLYNIVSIIIYYILYIIHTQTETKTESDEREREREREKEKE